MRKLGELPEDLNKQLQDLGPPPPWWDTSRSSQPSESTTVLIDIFPFLASADKFEMNKLNYLKNEYAVSPRVRRYTKVFPLSPFFRSDRAKFGYGGLGDGLPMGNLSLDSMLIGLIAGAYGYKKTKNLMYTGICAASAALISNLVIQ